MKVYFDNAATVKPQKEVIDYVTDILNNYWWNPNSGYEDAHKVREIINNARHIVAESIGAADDEIIFTSGSSESNSLAINGFLKKYEKSCLVTTKIEHDSITNMTDVGAYIVECNSDGLLCLNSLEEILSDCRRYGETPIVSVMTANNEIGTVQDIAKISELVHRYRGIFHTDFTQAYGKIHIDVKELNVDMLSASGQKIGGLKGSGFLYKKKVINISPIIYGTQEQGLRGGTENVIGIAALGKAAELIDYNKANFISELRDYCIKKLFEIDGCKINGSMEHRLPNNINVQIPNLDINSQQLVALLDLAGYEISAGSACSAHLAVPSHVLMAIGLSEKEANSSVRITLSEDNTYAEIDGFISALKWIVKQHRT